MLLRVRDVSAGYGSTQILRGVSLDVKSGEVVSVLGANGAGKTTTLRTISGIIETRGGSIEFDGQPLRRLSPERRAALGMGHVPEGRGILGGLTVDENLALGATLRNDGRRAIGHDRDRLLELFSPLKTVLTRRASILSGGQQQMLALARGLIGRPKLLMIDEMSFGLAPMIIEQLFGLVRDLRADGTAFLLVEQNAGVLAVSERTFVLRGGRSVMEAPSKELVQSERLVRAYMGAET